MVNNAVIAVDFDGTIFDFGRDGKLTLIPGAKEALGQFKNLGHKIVIYSCRTGIAQKEGKLFNEVNFMKGMLEINGIEYDEIFLGEKMVADVYIDDRGVAFKGDWNQAMRETLKHIDSIEEYEAI